MVEVGRGQVEVGADRVPEPSMVHVHVRSSAVVDDTLMGSWVEGHRHWGVHGGHP